MKRPEKPSPKPYTIDFEKRKKEGILTCPDDLLYDTEIVMCGKTQKECDAIALKIRNSKDRGGGIKPRQWLVGAYFQMQVIALEFIFQSRQT